MISENSIMIRIAVCDDDRTVRESIVKALRRYERDKGMEFEILEYAAADAMLVSYPAELDLILLDIYMPGIDGMDAAKAIRQFDQDVCIIFITTMQRVPLAESGRLFAAGRAAPDLYDAAQCGGQRFLN